MKSVLRASRIGRVLLRYRLDDLLEGTPVERWLRLAHPFVPRASAEIAAQPRGVRLRLATIKGALEHSLNEAGLSAIASSRHRTIRLAVRAIDYWVL